MWKSTVLLALFAASTTFAQNAVQAPNQHIPFNMGDLVSIDCPIIHPNGSISETEYEPLHCADTNTPLQLPYGMDALLQCVWALDPKMYSMISNSLAMKAAYSCRVPMSKEKTIYFPLTFSFWGKVEEGHIHLMTHWNFLFHAMDGFFLGGTVYPLRDHWVMAVENSVIMIHGPVRWFAGHTFEGTLQDAWLAQPDGTSDPGTIPQNNAANAEKGPPPPRPIIANKNAAANGGNVRPVKEKDLPTVSKLMSAVPRPVFIGYIFLSIAATVGIAALVYYAYLKPKLLLEKKKQ